MTDTLAVLASSNSAKAREITELLGDQACSVILQSTLGVDPAVEDGLSFVENALLKARHAARCTGYAAIADDSGIMVVGLDGKPGIYSARYAGSGASDAENMQKLIDAVRVLPEDGRQAHFVCVMVYVRDANDPMPLIAEGVWSGMVMTEPRGQYGFGYDPVFYVPSHACMAAELDPEVKNKISHRGVALGRLMARMSEIGLR